jgi:hypothetical protein
MMPRKYPLTSAWWALNGINANLRLLGSNARAPLFDPESQAHSFSIFGILLPTSVSAIDAGVISKWNTVGDKRSWLVRQNSANLEFSISQDGTATPVSTIVKSACLTAGVRSAFCARYGWISDGASTLDLNVDGADATQIADGHGPVFSSVLSDILLGAYDDSTVKRLGGNLFALALWNRRLSDAELGKLMGEELSLQDLGASFIIDFHKTVAATYAAEYPGANESGVVTFTVEGSPTAYSLNDGFLFDGIDDYYSLAGTDPLAANFDPNLNGNEFTIVGEITPLVAVSSFKTIFGKFLAAARSWSFYQTASLVFGFQVSKDASGSASTSVSTTSVSLGNKQFFCGRYKYIADNTSLLDLSVDAVSATSAIARGPVYSSTTIPVRIGSHDAAFWNGRTHWLAFWKRRLSNAEMLSLQAKAQTPQQLGCYFYLKFPAKDPTTASINSDIPSGAGVIPFTKNGAPAYYVGTALASVDSVCSTPGEITDPLQPGYFREIMKVSCSSLSKQDRPRELSKEVSTPAALIQKMVR